MKIRYYLEGKCIFSYDDEVFSSDEYHEMIEEWFIDPVRDKVYKKYYQKRLVQQVVENVIKRNNVVFQVYCDIKPLLENEDISVEYVQDDDTLIKRLMKEKLNSDEYAIFEELLEEAGNAAWKEEIDFLSSRSSMLEHFWVEIENDKNVNSR